MNCLFKRVLWLCTIPLAFHTHLLATLVPTEIHYNPKGSDDYEYVEFYNAGTAAIDLTRYVLVKDAKNDGLAFTFPAATLDAGAFIVVVEDATAFAARYQNASSAYNQEGVTVLGTWSGGLGNNGEVLILQDPSGQEVFQFKYDDASDWPAEANGLGSSLELKDPAEYAALTTTAERNKHLGDEDSWRASADYHGNPGRDGAKAQQSVVINEILANTDGGITDTIELYNPTAAAIDIGGWYLSDSTTFTKFRIPDGTQVAAGAYMIFNESDFNPNGDWNSNAGTPASTEFSFSGSKGDQLYLVQADASGNLLRMVDYVAFGATLSGESFGRWPDEDGPFTTMTTFTSGAANSGPRVGPIVISEFMYNAGTAVNANELEFIEIHNTGTVSETLDNWMLQAGVSYTFPVGTTLTAGGYLLVVGFNPADATKLAAFRTQYGLDSSVTPLGPWNGSLSNSGETLLLKRSDTNGDLLTDIDTGTTHYPLITEDEVAYSDGGDWPSRADGGGPTLSKKVFTDWGNSADSWRSSNEFKGNLLDIGKPQREIAITEVLSHTDYPLTDTIEVYNPGDTDIDIGGWYLSDTSEDTSDPENFRKFRIPDGTSLAAGAFLTFDETDFNPNVDPLTGLGTPAANHFALSSAYNDDVALVEANTDGTLVRIVDHVSIGPSENGVAFGLWPDLEGRLYPMQSNTLGSSNSGPATGSILFSEIHYNPGNLGNEDDLEFIELFNTHSSTVPLENWKLDNGVSFSFGSGHSIAAGGTLVVVGFDITDTTKLTAFRTEHGIDASVTVAGPWSGTLSNAGETVQLLKPDTLEVPTDGSAPFYPMLLAERVRYDDTAPWPTEADGQGQSLERTNPYTWSDTVTNWNASSTNPAPGTYSVGNFPPVFTSIAVTAATEDSAYAYAITAVDSNPGETPALSITIGANWLNLTDNGNGTGTLVGTPLNANVGSHLITLSASDGTNIIQQQFTIEVANVNDAPSFASTAVTSAMNTRAYSYTATVDDPDTTDSLTLTATILPAWMTFSDNGDGTAILSGIPAQADIGDHAVSLKVDDGTISADQTFTVTVVEENQIPTAITLNNNSLAENLAAPYVVGSLSATDTEATDTHTFSLVAGSGSDDNSNFSVSGSSLLTATTLDYEAKSSYSIRVQTTDSADNTYAESFTINLLNDSTEDADSDGLTEAQEDALGTSDSSADSDNDSVNDAEEVTIGSDPADSSSTPSAPSRGATQLVDGWMALEWFGLFKDEFNGWIYHLRLGWIYLQGSSTTSLLVWDSEWGWLWTSDSTYPWLYRFSQNGWLYYYRGDDELGSSNPRWFWDSSASQWMSTP